MKREQAEALLSTVRARLALQEHQVRNEVTAYLLQQAEFVSQASGIQALEIQLQVQQRLASAWFLPAVPGRWIPHGVVQRFVRALTWQLSCTAPTPELSAQDAELFLNLADILGLDALGSPKSRLGVDVLDPLSRTPLNDVK